MSNSAVAADEYVSIQEYLNQLAEQQKPPQIYGELVKQSKASSFYFAGEPYQGKSSRIFAIYNTPKNTKPPFPAVVLVHGGGGTAFKQWVQKWNDAGFAAIAIAVEGQTDIVNENSTGRANKWQHHKWSGPARNKIYADSKQPMLDQWMFHASSAVIRAHNLLRSFDEIDDTKIGLSGISWGGVISSTVLGFDQRFAFAVPIYGSGALSGMENQYGKALKNNAVYQTFWEPNLRLGNYQGPTLWLTGLKEKHFSLDGQAETYKTVSGLHQVSILENLKHGHGAAWRTNEPYAFARTVVNQSQFPVRFSEQVINNQQVKIILNRVGKLEELSELTSASLWLTKDSGHTGKRQWQKLPVKVTANVIDHEQKTTFSASLPEQTISWFFNVEIDGLTYSSDFSTVSH
ncbi:MAG: dienelactone hydrolase [Colwellia sp.]